MFGVNFDVHVMRKVLSAEKKMAQNEEKQRKQNEDLRRQALAGWVSSWGGSSGGNYTVLDKRIIPVCVLLRFLLVPGMSTSLVLRSFSLVLSRRSRPKDQPFVAADKVSRASCSVGKRFRRTV